MDQKDWPAALRHLSLRLSSGGGTPPTDNVQKASFKVTTKPPRGLEMFSLSKPHVVLYTDQANSKAQHWNRLGGGGRYTYTTLKAFSLSTERRTAASKASTSAFDVF